jgi:hypothetical protein
MTILSNGSSAAPYRQLVVLPLHSFLPSLPLVFLLGLAEDARSALVQEAGHSTQTASDGATPFSLAI